MKITHFEENSCPRGYITITYLHKSAGWSVGFISNPTSLYPPASEIYIFALFFSIIL